jgi:uncharacterized membrane protein YhiD involved in acid resistance
MKMCTLRHFLFYMAVAAVLGAVIGVTRVVMDWSDGLTFAVAVVAGTISSTIAVREDLFGPPRHSHEQRDHHV